MFAETINFINSILNIFIIFIVLSTLSIYFYISRNSKNIKDHIFIFLFSFVFSFGVLFCLTYVSVILHQ